MDIVLDNDSDPLAEFNQLSQGPSQELTLQDEKKAFKLVEKQLKQEKKQEKQQKKQEKQEKNKSKEEQALEKEGLIQKILLYTTDDIFGPELQKKGFKYTYSKLNKKSPEQLADIIARIKLSLTTNNSSQFVASGVLTGVKGTELLLHRAYNIDGLSDVLKHDEEWNRTLREVQLEYAQTMYIRPEYRLAMQTVGHAISVHNMNKIMEKKKKKALEKKVKKPEIVDEKHNDDMNYLDKLALEEEKRLEKQKKENLERKKFEEEKAKLEEEKRKLEEEKAKLKEKQEQNEQNEQAEQLANEEQLETPNNTPKHDSTPVPLGELENFEAFECELPASYLS